MSEKPVGPYLVLTDYGMEGWSLRNADDFEAAWKAREEQLNSGSGADSVVIVKIVQTQVVEVDGRVSVGADGMRGISLRRAILATMQREMADGTEMHYREIMALVETAEGRKVAGVDPIATFLTQLTRVEGVEGVGRRTGIYRLALDEA